MRIYVHGNCQASALRWLLSSLEGVEANSREVHLFDPNDPGEAKAFKDDIYSADVILTQPIADEYKAADFLSLKWIKENASAGASVITFPSIYFRGYNPSHYALEMRGHITDYHDVHIADMYRRGVPPLECAARLRSASFFTSEFVHSELFISLRNLMIREQRFALDLKCSGFIALNLSSYLFYTFNHPSREVLVHIANNFLGLIGLPASLAIEGIEYLDQTVIPLYPSLAKCLGMRQSDNDDVRLPRVTCCWDDFVQQVYASYDSLGGKVVVSRQLDSHAAARRYLQRFHRYGVAPEADVLSVSELMVRQLYADILGRSPGASEIAYWIEIIKGGGLLAAIDQIRVSDEALSRSRPSTH